MSVQPTKPAGFSPKFEVAGCFVESDGEILFLHRQDHKPQGDTWSLPAGKTDGQPPRVAMRRELWEETEILVDEPDFLDLGRLYVRFPEQDFIYHQFRIVFPERPRVAIRFDEHKRYRWAPPKAALNMKLIPDLEDRIRLHYPDAT